LLLTHEILKRISHLRNLLMDANNLIVRFPFLPRNFRLK